MKNARAKQGMPNPAGAVGAPIASLFHIGGHGRRATDRHRYAFP